MWKDNLVQKIEIDQNHKIGTNRHPNIRSKDYWGCIISVYNYSAS